MKKKVFMMIILIMAFCLVPTVFAADITGCNNLINGVKIDTKIVNLTHSAILIIQIAVPVILVIFGMLDLFKGLTAQKEDEIKKGQQLFIKRLIAAALVFFVVAIVKLLVSFVADDKKEDILTCFNCFINGAKNDGTCNTK